MPHWGIFIIKTFTIQVEIVKWLNGDSEDNNYCRESKHYEGYESPIMRYCIVKVLERDFEICDSKWFQANGMRVITKPALFESKEVQRGMEQTIPRRVVYFLKSNFIHIRTKIAWFYEFDIWIFYLNIITHSAFGY